MLKCYADWTEGNNYYMIGRLEDASNAHDRGKFRCFVYERSFDGKLIRMASSTEESCYGLDVNEGPKLLQLSARAQPSASSVAHSANSNANKCHFPAYIHAYADNWLSVDNSLIYMFNTNSTKYQVKETREGNIIEEATCLQQFTLPTNQLAASAIAQAQTRINQQQAASNRRLPSVATAAADPINYQATRHNDVVYLVQITKNW